MWVVISLLDETTISTTHHVRSTVGISMEKSKPFTSKSSTYLGSRWIGWIRKASIGPTELTLALFAEVWLRVRGSYNKSRHTTTYYHIQHIHIYTRNSLILTYIKLHIRTYTQTLISLFNHTHTHTHTHTHRCCFLCYWWNTFISYLTFSLRH